MNRNGGDIHSKLPVFDGKNWNRWKIQMHVLFGSQDVLDLVTDDYDMLEADATEAQKITQKALRKKDQKVLFYIHQCVDVNVFEKMYSSSLTLFTTVSHFLITSWYLLWSNFLNS